MTCPARQRSGRAGAPFLTLGEVADSQSGMSVLLIVAFRLIQHCFPSIGFRQYQAVHTPLSTSNFTPHPSSTARSDVALSLTQLFAWVVSSRRQSSCLILTIGGGRLACLGSISSVGSIDGPEPDVANVRILIHSPRLCSFVGDPVLWQTDNFHSCFGGSRRITERF
ncbi:hypothetical protein JAAARDRAFT_444071 [Jaapia argillacea MUCL 33604]|uniref:Uncharacterized protein n=1 Tax=Jaapia argillacea MUCL 33604 TaxID=933084 RepID=A0A067PRV5_9AGAM|nr:hypothetical protein JAAARDRAFT_444071 [Jaapia argillacea MUCL 33604]